MSADPSGEQVAQAAIDAAVAVLGDDLAAAYVLGSLAHGGFAPLVSDVDVGLVLTAVDAGTAARVEQVYARTSSDSPLARRLSVFWSDPRGVREGAGPHDRLPAADRLDLIDSGRLVRGDDHRHGATPPGTEELIVEAARFAVTRLDRPEPARLLADGVRATTKAVLFPVRFRYTAATGRLGRNDDAASWFVATGHPGAPLVDAAARWRVGDLDDAALPLLTEHLRALYDGFAIDYAERLDAMGHPALALRAREHFLVL